jgi:hypothetical protein
MTTQADAGNKLFADETIKLIDKMENELAKAQMLIARQDRQIQQLNCLGRRNRTEGGEKEMKTSDFEEGYLAARVEQQIIIDEQVRQIEMLREALEKISLFCPPDTTVDQLDESPDMAIRLHNAEIGDTARCALAATKEMK